ncbi:porin [Ideonella azotifigens]|nr:porin [Ideonella azotifigens]MCD2342423.1 porin [Ideonella azotifigens]
MKKTLLALAVLGAFAGAASAQSSVTVYGKLDLALAKTVASKDKQVADNNGSRIGFKGSEDLGNGMSAIFRIESQISADTGAAQGGTTFWNRWSSVGLNTKFGSLQLGRMESGAWDVVSSADPFGGDTIAQLRDVGATLRTSKFDATQALVDVRRLDNSVRYDGAFGAFKLSASVAETYGAGTEKPYAVGASYTMGSLMVGGAYEATTFENQKMWTAVGSYDFGMAKLSGSYSDGKTINDVDVKGFLVGVVVPYGAINLKAGYAQSKVDFAAGSQTLKKAGLGVEYKLSKRTKIYADYARIGGDVGGSLAADNKNGYDFGLSHSF